MSVKISENHRNFLGEIALKNGFENYEITLDRGSVKGDNYMGTIIFVKITEISTDKKLHLVLKTAPQGTSLREKMPIDRAYNREYFIYTAVFREFSDLLRRFDAAKTFDISAKIYGGLTVANEECLALENLTENGFELWDRKKPMNTRHVGIAMSRYGKFHAYSYALRKLRPEKFAEIAKNLTDIFEGKFNLDEWRTSFESLMVSVNRAVEGNPEATDGLRSFSNSFQDLLGIIATVRNKFDVIIHGDCWCNNMLFKYEKNSQTPSDIRLIDWQLSKIGNPVMDLSYFFLACSSKCCLDDYKKFLKIYHDSLADTLSIFELQVNDFVTYEELEEQWRNNVTYGFYLALLVIKVMLTEQEEAGDLGELTEAGKNVMDIFNVEISRNEEYEERIRIVVNYMVENEFI